MPVIKTIKFKGGGTLLYLSDGRRSYIPSQAYKEFRKQQLISKSFRSKHEQDIRDENCFRLLAAVFGYKGYPIVENKRNPFKTTILPGAPENRMIWKDEV